jgi:hypothetical protein
LQNDRINEVPSEADWGDYSFDPYYHDQYIGKTREEMLTRFCTLPVSVFEDLDFMTDVCFQYYVLGYELIFMNPDTQPKTDEFEMSDCASCFLNLLLHKLEKSPTTIMPVMERLLPTVRFVAANQERFEASPEIYGSFPEKLHEIERLYEIKKQS